MQNDRLLNHLSRVENRFFSDPAALRGWRANSSQADLLRALQFSVYLLAGEVERVETAEGKIFYALPEHARGLLVDWALSVLDTGKLSPVEEGAA